MPHRSLKWSRLPPLWTLITVALMSLESGQWSQVALVIMPGVMSSHLRLTSPVESHTSDLKCTQLGKLILTKVLKPFGFISSYLAPVSSTKADEL